MDPFTTPGAFSWNELMTRDPAGATDFYGALFGWTFQSMDMADMGTYRVAKVGDAMIGGVMDMPPDAPPGMPPHWACYVTVTDAAATAAKVVELGGKVLVPPMVVPTVGTMAVIQDPQGAVLNVMAYDPKAG